MYYKYSTTKQVKTVHYYFHGIKHMECIIKKNFKWSFFIKWVTLVNDKALWILVNARFYFRCNLGFVRIKMELGMELMLEIKVAQKETRCLKKSKMIKMPPTKSANNQKQQNGDALLGIMKELINKNKQLYEKGQKECLC